VHVAPQHAQDPVAAPHSGFRYGTDYPKPVLQPVSIRGIEETEDAARRAQEQRDRQNAVTRRRGNAINSSRQRFDKMQWESSRLQWPAETPTAATSPRSYDRPAMDSKGSKGGKGGKGDKNGYNDYRSCGENGGWDRSDGWGGNDNCSGGNGTGQSWSQERKRRWGGQR